MEEFSHTGMSVPTNNNTSADTSGGSTATTAGDLYHQINQLNHRFTSYQLENDQKLEQINIKTSFQLQLINERLSSMESKFASLHHDIFSMRKDVANTPAGVAGATDTSDNIQRKIEIIGKHMADLSSDITKLNPNENSNTSTPNSAGAVGAGAGGGNPAARAETGSGGPNSAGPASAGPISGGLMNSASINSNNLHLQDQISTIAHPSLSADRHNNNSDVDRFMSNNAMGASGAAANPAADSVGKTQFLDQAVMSDQNLSSVKGAATTADVLHPLTRPLPASTISDPLSNRAHQPNASNSTAALLNTNKDISNNSANTSNVNINNSTNSNSNNASTTQNNTPMSTFADGGLIDINKQWSRALGIRSPGVESPFTPKQMSFDYSIPINRALSFNNNPNPGNNALMGQNANQAGVTNLATSTPPTTAAIAAAAASGQLAPGSIPPISTMPQHHQSVNQVVNSVNSLNSVASVPSANSVNSAASVNSIDSVNSGPAVAGSDVVESLEKKKLENNLLSSIENTGTNFNLIDGGVSPGLGAGMSSDSIEHGYKRRRKSSKSSDSSGNKSPMNMSSVGSTGSGSGGTGTGSASGGGNGANGTYNNKSFKNPDAPQYKLEKGARDVSEIWKEYEYGINGKPPLKSLEIKYNARWRNDTESRTFVRRKKIYNAIETGKAKGYNEEDIINELESLRTYYSNGTVKKKPLSWLYTNIPKKYQP